MPPPRPGPAKPPPMVGGWAPPRAPKLPGGAPPNRPPAPGPAPPPGPPATPVVAGPPDGNVPLVAWPRVWNDQLAGAISNAARAVASAALRQRLELGMAITHA